MPLRDHFRPPLSAERHWESFHATWAGKIADSLNDTLPRGFFAEEYTPGGARVEIDIATFEDAIQPLSPTINSSGIAMLAPATWTPPAVDWTIPSVTPENFEVRVFSSTGGPTLVGAIELVSPANKDRPEHRRALAVKCASYLYQGISLIIADIVTERHVNLHNEMMSLMNLADRFALPSQWPLYGTAYRPVLRDEAEQIDVWARCLSVGEPLPVLPLRLTGDLFTAVDLEGAYMTALQRRRLA